MIATMRRWSLLVLLTAALATVGPARAATTTNAGRIHIVAVIRTADMVGEFAYGASSVWAPDVQRTQLLRIDPRNGRIVARISIGRPLTFVDDQDQVDGWVTVADGFVWATDQWHNRIVRVSPGSDRVVGSIRVPSPWDLAVSDGSVWVPEFEPYAVARIDEQRDAIVKRWPAVGPTSVAAGAGSIWVVLHRADEVLRIDPSTNGILATIPLRQATSPERAFFLFGSLWVNDGNDTNSILRIDPATNKVSAVIRPPGSSFGNNLVSDGRWLWDVSPIGRVYKIDPHSNRIVEQQSLATPGKCGDGLGPCFFTGAGYGGGTIWTYDVARHAIIRIAD